MNYLAVSSEAIGYGRLGMRLKAALERQGVDLYDDLPDPHGTNAKFIPPGARSATCSHVSWISTPGHARGWWEGQTKSILTMWESNILPEPFRESLDQFDTVVVPSEQNQELFGQYHNNVKYVPLGIEPDDWHLIDRPTMNEPFFNFFISGGGKRKGSDLVIDAFRKVFDTWPDGMPIPRLYVHTAKAQEIPHDERIQLITGMMTPEEEQALYAMSHVFVFPSRGEGFGLRPLQAIAQGMPTIATDAHGHKAFSHLMTHPLPWSLTETPPQSFHHGPAGSWWEPDFDALCEAMEDAYYHYDDHVVAARGYAERAVKEFNWDVCASKYLDAIGRENLELNDITPTQWIVPEIRRYLVQVNQPRMMEVGGVQYLMEPGKNYWEPADVKRVLFESGALDISCLPQNVTPDIDIGLSLEQVEQIPAYTGAHSICPTCTQKLNTNRPTLEELEALPMPV
jgi:hypothetical protein